MSVNSDKSRRGFFEPSNPGEDKKWWETLEGHRFAGEVLQLQIRRKIMKFIGTEIRTRDEIKKTFDLSDFAAELHLSLLERAEMIEKVEDGYTSTQIGIAYLKNFEDFAVK
jgi:DNA-binding transcriptional ArsR family regulator